MTSFKTGSEHFAEFILSEAKDLHRLREAIPKRGKQSKDCFGTLGCFITFAMTFLAMTRQGSNVSLKVLDDYMTTT